MNNFEIDVHKGNEPIGFILCPQKKLRIKVIPPGKQPNEYLDHQMIITAKFNDKGRNYDFEIIELVFGQVNKDWSMELFFEAIEYYCQNILDKEPDGFDYNAGNPKFFPYDNSTDYAQ